MEFDSAELEYFIHVSKTYNHMFPIYRHVAIDGNKAITTTMYVSNDIVSTIKRETDIDYHTMPYEWRADVYSITNYITNCYFKTNMCSK